MNGYMSNIKNPAIITGILFLIAISAGIASGFLIPESKLMHDNEGLSTHKPSIILGVLAGFVMAAACAGIAVSLFPILKNYSESLALASVGFRLTEGILYCMSVIMVLALSSLNHEQIAVNGVNGSMNVIARDILLTVRRWSLLAGMLAFTSGALIYYALFFVHDIIPRWLSGWGLVGAALAMVSNLFVLRGYYRSSPAVIFMNIPIGLNELVLAIWLIANGFNRNAVMVVE
ncbi:MAG: DUF4386 family protein [Chitinivibrionales bacterium]|nr:DUF4386 family protein [Chitinivibrionales bacterium]